MNSLRIASVLQLFLAPLGLRKARDPPEAAQSVPTAYPASSSCLLGSGFGMQRGCQYPEAMEPVPSCDDASSSQACYSVSKAERVRGYMRDVRSSSDYSSLTRSVTEAEGGGYGQTASAGFSYMKRSEVSESSLAFFLGASGRTQTRTIQRPVKMKLTSAAADLLRQDPREFITRYGLRYIHSISYGGSFLGSVTLNSRKTKDDTDIEAFVKFSVNDGLFSLNGSTEFQDTLSQQNLRVSVFINAEWVGGSGIEQNYENPEKLNKMFNDWDKSWRAHPAPLTITTRRWKDSAEVQEIVNSMSAEDRALFNTRDVTPPLLREISDESAQATLTDTSVRRALTWTETRNDQVARTCLKELEREVSAHLIRINLLDEATMLDIQEQWLKGNYSWFRSDGLHARYMKCVEGLELEPEPVDVIVGAESIALNERRKFENYIPIDTNEGFNEGFEGKVVYVRARVERSLTGCAGFVFKQSRKKEHHEKGTGDLADGTGGNYRYIVPVGSVPAEHAVKFVWWQMGKGNNKVDESLLDGNCTDDINEGRAGRYMYFCWSTCAHCGGTAAENRT